VPPFPLSRSLCRRGSGRALRGGRAGRDCAIRRVQNQHTVVLGTLSEDASRLKAGSDLGIRQNWMPLFYQYGVDFVLAGHDHDYERSYVVRGVDPDTVLRPHVISTDLDNVDSDLGLVHLVIGTGGTHGHDDVYMTDSTDNEPEEGINVSGTEIVTEDAPWSAVTDPNTTYPTPLQYDGFTATRTRSDGFGFRRRQAK